MCGINGFNFHDRKLIEKMNELTKHRGPDGTGVFVNDKVSLGHNRLAIIDFSPAGAQPMFNEAKTLAIVFNGEIYNFPEIKKELEALGYRFRSATDTEVLLYAYEKWEEKCLEKLNGMFAFAIAHLKEDKIFFARDRIGIKPLYYYQKDGKFIFSSEIKALLADDSVPRAINFDALNLYFRLLYIPAPFTIWENIFKLPAGSYAIVSAGKPVIKKYWEVSDFEDLKDREEMKRKIQELVLDSVKMQLVSDRPLGLFLSGGIDSTAVLGAMTRVTGDIHTFSVGFEKTPEEEKFNLDFNLARRTAKFYGTTHEEFIVSARDIKENLAKAVYQMDEPVSNPIQTVNMLLASCTVDKATVILGGDGGDEVFGGYERYYWSRILDRFDRLPKFLKARVGKAAGLFSASAADKLSSSIGAERYLSFWSQKEDLLRSFLKPEINRPEVTPNFFKDNYFQKIFAQDFTKQFMLTDLLTWLPDESLARSDKMAMAAGMEYRVPLLDHRLVELGFRIPTFEKVNWRGSSKWIFKEAMEGYIPPHVLKQSKRGWFSPAAKWIRKELKPIMEEILSSGFCRETSEFLDFEAIRKIFEDHCEKRRYALNTIWSLLTFQLWVKRYIDYGKD